MASSHIFVFYIYSILFNKERFSMGFKNNDKAILLIESGEPDF